MLFCTISIVKCTFFERVCGNDPGIFEGENFTVVDDDDNSVKNAIDIPKGQIQFIFWSNSSSSTLLQTSLLRGQEASMVGSMVPILLVSAKTSHVEPPPGAFVCIRDDDDDVLKHFSSFFVLVAPFFSRTKCLGIIFLGH